MRILFCIFILFILLLFELFIGMAGWYIPLMWMGFFYFFESDYPRRFLLPFGFATALVIDLLLFYRLLLPDVFIWCGVLYYGERYKDFWRSSMLSGSCFAFVLFLLAYTIQNVSAWFLNGFSVKNFSDSAAQMTTFVVFGFLFMLLLIRVLDALQKRMKFEKTFITKQRSRGITAYHRRRGSND